MPLCPILTWPPTDPPTAAYPVPWPFILTAACRGRPKMLRLVQGARPRPLLAPEQPRTSPVGFNSWRERHGSRKPVTRLYSIAVPEVEVDSGATEEAQGPSRTLATLESLSRKTAEFASCSKLHCRSGCGACCLSPSIEVGTFENLAAWHPHVGSASAHMRVPSLQVLLFQVSCNPFTLHICMDC